MPFFNHHLRKRCYKFLASILIYLSTAANAPSPYLPSTPVGQPMTPSSASYLPGTPGGQPMTPGTGGLDVMSPIGLNLTALLFFRLYIYGISVIEVLSSPLSYAEFSRSENAKLFDNMKYIWIHTLHMLL